MTCISHGVVVPAKAGTQSHKMKRYRKDLYGEEFHYIHVKFLEHFANDFIHNKSVGFIEIPMQFRR